jgi:hypothetical protein
MRFIFVSLIMLSWGLSIQAQCFENSHAFSPGEKVIYNAYYNWGFVWINAGKVTFSVNDTSWNEKPAFHFKGYGATYRAYDIFFRVRDSFDVWVDPYSLKPFEFHRRTNEGSYSAHYHYLFDDENRQIKTSISKEGDAYRDSIITWPKCSFDLLSMVYQARNIDFSSYSVNDKIPISMIVDGEVYNLYIRYLGKETIKDRSGRKFRCLKFSPLLVEGTIFEEGEKMAVWVTDDKNKIPIIVEAKILVGSVKAVFVEAKGLEHPIAAEIKEETETR